MLFPVIAGVVLVGDVAQPPKYMVCEVFAGFGYDDVGAADEISVGVPLFV